MTIKLPPLPTLTPAGADIYCSGTLPDDPDFNPGTNPTRTPVTVA